MVDPRTPAEMLFAAASEMKDTMISSSIRREEKGKGGRGRGKAFSFFK
jgi:hypothetical protein